MVAAGSGVVARDRLGEPVGAGTGLLAAVGDPVGAGAGLVTTGETAAVGDTAGFGAGDSSANALVADTAPSAATTVTAAAIETVRRFRRITFLLCSLGDPLQ